MKVIIVPDPDQAGIAVANAWRDDAIRKAMILPEDISVGPAPRHAEEPTSEQKYLLKAQHRGLREEIARLGKLVEAMYPDTQPKISEVA